MDGKTSQEVRVEIGQMDSYFRLQDALEADLGDNRICVLQTGIGGEKQVLYAAIVNQLRHFHGRASLGAGMGRSNAGSIRERMQPAAPYAFNG